MKKSKKTYNKIETELTRISNLDFGPASSIKNTTDAMSRGLFGAVIAKLMKAKSDNEFNEQGVASLIMLNQSSYDYMVS